MSIRSDVVEGPTHRTWHREGNVNMVALSQVGVVKNTEGTKAMSLDHARTINVGDPDAVLVNVKARKSLQNV